MGVVVCGVGGVHFQALKGEGGDHQTGSEERSHLRATLVGFSQLFGGAESSWYVLGRGDVGGAGKQTE